MIQTSLHIGKKRSQLLCNLLSTAILYEKTSYVQGSYLYAELVPFSLVPLLTAVAVHP
jgi:hypothetical protein